MTWKFKSRVFSQTLQALMSESFLTQLFEDKSKNLRLEYVSKLVKTKTSLLLLVYL